MDIISTTEYGSRPFDLGYLIRKIEKDILTLVSGVDFIVLSCPPDDTSLGWSRELDPGESSAVQDMFDYPENYNDDPDIIGEMRQEYVAELLKSGKKAVGVFLGVTEGGKYSVEIEILCPCGSGIVLWAVECESIISSIDVDDQVIIMWIDIPDPGGLYIVTVGDPIPE